MARSLTEVAQARQSLPHDKSHNNPFQAGQSVFSVDRHGEQIIHRRSRPDERGRPIFQTEMTVNYVFGSGAHGHSYMSDRDGYLFQTPISWFAQKKTWDLSPGFRGSWLAGRPIHPYCLYCHANRTLPVEGTMNRYNRPIFPLGTGIGCERCHGPGEKHVNDPGPFDPETRTDYSIVNPKKMAYALRESVCEQCHLESAGRVLRRGRGLHDFRPGLALESVWSVFVPAAEENGEEAVNHVRQMHESRCFEKSSGEARLACLSCHDPHRRIGPEERVAFYRERCLRCHAQEKKGAGRVPCALAPVIRRRQNQHDSCIDCHMPSYPAVDVAHHAATNHRIERLGPAGGKRMHRPRGQPSAPVAHFHRGQGRDEDPELARDMGVAMVRLLSERQLPPWQIDPAIQLLTRALRRCPDDLDAWEEKGKALALEGRNGEALACVEKVLIQAPRREVSLALAGSLAQAMGLTDRALDYWQRAVAVNPWLPEYHGSLAVLLSRQQAWTEAGARCRSWLRLEPDSIDGRKLLILCLLHSGRRDEARTELQRIEAMRPAGLDEIRAWFAAQVPSK
jgi:tetratricopeptide (TPR) repeat protein